MGVGGQLKGRVALVTGGARGIGKATATAMLQSGATVAIADVDRQAAEATAEELGRYGIVRAYALDVTDRREFEDVVQAVESELGPVDVLVNNAGIMVLGDFLQLDESLDSRQIDINVFGVIHGMRTVLPSMIRRRTGHVVNIASSAGRVGVPFSAVYSATKFAVIGLTEAVRYELKDTGVTFSYVMPGLVQTELISGVRGLRWPPPATPEQVAAAVVAGVRDEKIDIYVPRIGRLAMVFPALVPRRVYEAIGEFLGIATVFENVDPAGRAAYRRRAVTPSP